MPEEDKPDFEVIDRRHSAQEQSEAAEEPPAEPEPSEAQPAPVAEEPPAEAAPASDTAEEAPSAEELAQLFTAEYALAAAIDQFQRLAWVGLGLQPHPITGKVAEDLPEARVAIDVLGDLVDRFEQLRGEKEVRDLRLVLSNLRINYVQRAPQ